MKTTFAIVSVLSGLLVAGCGKKDAPKPAAPIPAAAPAAPPPAATTAEPAKEAAPADEPSAAAEPGAAAEPSAAPPVEAAVAPADEPAAADAPAGAPAAEPAAADAPAGPGSSEADCSKAIDHIIAIFERDETLPAEAKASIKAEMGDPGKRGKALQECMKEKPEMTACMLEASNVAGITTCGMQHSKSRPAGEPSPESAGEPSPEPAGEPSPEPAGEAAPALKGNRVVIDKDG